MRSRFYEILLKPIFFRMYPEDAHDLSRRLLRLANGIPGILQILEKLSTYKSKRLETTVSGIHFPNPLGLAAGFDKTGELYPYLSRLGFGHIEVGTITGEEQPGNPKPRVFRLEKEEALINRMGFNNPGSEKAFRILSSQEKNSIRGINAGKTKLVPPEDAVSDYCKTFNLLAPLCEYGVINISSPNTPGLRGFQEKDSFLSLISGIKQGLGGKFPLPMFVKLAPDLEQSALEELLDLVLETNLAGVILTNTTTDPSVLPYPVPETGGISGKVLQQKSSEFIQLAYSKLQGKIPIIGVGGIFDGKSALEKILSGASLIQIYTGYIYRGPFLPYEILSFLDTFMEKHKINSIQELVGQKKSDRFKIA